MRTLIENLPIGAVVALSLGSSAALAQPPVPDKLQVPPGNILYLTGHARGTQNYICMPSGGGYAWTFLSPTATLFITFKLFGNDVDQQITTHFLSPNPEEGGRPRPTWQSSLDTSSVWAQAIASTTDPAYVADSAIPWLLLQQVGQRPGPTGGTILSNTTYIQRLNTEGGLAPATGCSQPENVGVTALVPYKTDYFFHKAIRTR